MAEKLSTQRDGESEELVNSGARTEALQKAMKELAALEAEKDALTEIHLAPVRDNIRKVKQNMKAETGVEITDFNLLFKLYKRQEQATMMREDDGARIIDNLRETFGALQKGEMLNFLPALGDAAR